MGAATSTSIEGRDDAIADIKRLILYGPIDFFFSQMHLIYNATGKDIIVTAFDHCRKFFLYQIPFMTSRRISAKISCPFSVENKNMPFFIYSAAKKKKQLLKTHETTLCAV
eukprot:GEMP01146088.1.p1 GENE.GEMP01146088.1~~GEMP01146088.1.p1  ORF type:complete len:111 (+),score=5.54 GEMP01146088.1:33-365(+)